MATMEGERLANYATVGEAATVLGVNERRVRNWQNLGLLAPALTVGRIQFSRADVVRCAVLLSLQEVFGTDSALAVEMARALDPQQLDALLCSEDPTIHVSIERLQRTFTVGLDPEGLEVVRERLAAIRR